MFKRAIASLVIAFVSACTPPASDPVCPADGSAASIQVTAQLNPGSPPLRDDLLVTGTAVDDDDLAIRQVLVNGVEATNTGFNFSSWSATVPVATLAAQADSDGQVKITVRAVDVCGTSADLFTSEPFTVDTTPGIRVDSLQLILAPPDSQGFLPADGVIPATVRLSANPEAAGAVVTLTSSIGALQGTADGTVTLSGDGRTQPASALLLFASSKPGNVLVTASAKNQTATATVLVAGPPILVPASATLAIGQKLTVTALSNGNVSACDVVPGTGFTATTKVVSATQVEITIDAAGAMSGSSVNVVCRDAFDQTSSPGVYSIP